MFKKCPCWLTCQPLDIENCCIDFLFITLARNRDWCCDMSMAGNGILQRRLKGRIRGFRLLKHIKIMVLCPQQSCVTKQPHCSIHLSLLPARSLCILARLDPCTAGILFWRRARQPVNNALTKKSCVGDRTCACCINNEVSWPSLI